jgi:hypothetical protein
MEQEKKEECKTCKKGLSMSQKSMIVLSFYMLLSAIYGTYIIINQLVESFF